MKNHLDQEHIQKRSSPNTQQSISLPYVNQYNGNGCDELRHSKGRGKYCGILKAVNYEHADNGKRKDFTEVGNVSRGFPVPREQ